MMLIAECGMNHFGDVARAKKLIDEAKKAGATHVKFSLFKAADVSPFGSMPPGFYQECELTLPQWKEIAAHADAEKMPIFFSCFSEEFSEFALGFRWKKISGRQCVENLAAGRFQDFANTLVSFKKDTLFRATEFASATPLYVSEYLANDPELFRLDYLCRLRFGRAYGYSDHTVGIDAAIAAVQLFGARVVEKHFTLEKNCTFQGVAFRDTVFGADPMEFFKLSRRLRL